MHSLLAVASEAMEVKINGRSDSAVVNHRAVVRGGAISNNTPTHLFSSYPSNHGHLTTAGSNGRPNKLNGMSTKIRRDHLLNLVSVNTFKNNTISNDANKSTTQRPNVDLGSHRTVGLMLGDGTRRTLYLPLTRPWGQSLDVRGVADLIMRRISVLHLVATKVTVICVVSMATAGTTASKPIGSRPTACERHDLPSAE